MPVTPYSANLFQDQKELYELFLTCQQKSIEKNCPQIVSISQEIPKVDPLAVLREIRQQHQHFYLEQRRKKIAIAAIGYAISTTIEGSDRFSQGQFFIQTCIDSTTTVGDLDLPFSGVHFFCSFSFFDRQLNAGLFPAATLFLPKFQVTTYQNQSILVINLQLTPKDNLEHLTETLSHQLKAILKIKVYPTQPKYLPGKFIQPDTAETAHFKLAVSSALKSIQDNKFSKIVLANAINVISSSPLDVISSLDNLRKCYPDCYVFAFSNSEGKTFMGASPERLISIRDRTLITDALAGSAPRGKTVAEDIKFATQLISSEKERREHQAVSDFIIRCLSQLNIEPQMLPIPRILKLSNIQHLWTPIQAHVSMNVYPLDIVAKLHPTPAVAGVPRNIALKHILRYEHFDRGLYAAPLGWIDYQGNSEFIVGIRSALIEGSQARLYAGAGIVIGSNPDKELAEVQLKFQALLKALV